MRHIPRVPAVSRLKSPVATEVLTGSCSSLRTKLHAQRAAMEAAISAQHLRATLPALPGGNRVKEPARTAFRLFLLSFGLPPLSPFSPLEDETVRN